MKRLSLIFLSVLLLAGCERAEQPGESQLVVEGWIESGGHPVVMVSESIGIATGLAIDAREMMDHVAKWAKVSVSDGTETVVLTGMSDSQYFPPYIFTSSKVTGEVGKTYELTVEYKDYSARARTTIPEPVPLDSAYVESVSDSLCSVVCTFTDPAPKGNCYKVFTKTEGKDSHYHPSALATVSDDNLDGPTKMFLYSTQRLMDYVDMPNMKLDETLWIKLCTMDRGSFEYWNNFEIMLASNAFGTFFENSLDSNMQGALGYWAGYGVAGERSLKLTDPSQTGKSDSE